MKTIENGNLFIEVETINCFERKVTAYKVENGSIVAFLGKYIVDNGFTDEAITNLFRR